MAASEGTTTATPGTSSAMASCLPIGTMKEDALAHGIRLETVAPDQRGRTYAVVVFAEDNDPVPPTYSHELMHLLAFQSEHTKRGFVHLQCYVVMRSRHTASKTLRLLFPTKKNPSTFIAMAHKGTSHATMLAYCAKPESRVAGTKPTVHGDLDEVVVKKETPTVNNLQNIIATVQAQPSLQAVYTHPHTMKYASSRPNWTAQVWQQRPATLPPKAAAHPLLAWQRAVLFEIQAVPDERILWVDIGEAAISEALYLAKLLRCAAKDRVLLADGSEPRAGVFHKASEAKDVIVVTQLGDATLSLSTLLHLKAGLCSASTQTGSSNTLATFRPRHVLVMSTTPIPKTSKLHPHVKTLDATDNSQTDGLRSLPKGEFITLAQACDLAAQNEEANQESKGGLGPTAHSSTDVDSASDDDAHHEAGDSHRKKARVS